MRTAETQKRAHALPSRMMRTLAVFGATGNAGRLVVDRALAQGWTVRAFCRPESRLPATHPSLTRIDGSLDSPDQVREALRGSEAVVVVFGPRRDAGATDVFCARGTKTILEGMAGMGISRLICQTGAMVGADYANRGSFYDRMRRRFVARSPDLARDRDEQERLVRESPLDWTVVKPPRIVDREGKGRWNADPDLPLGMMSAISYEDLASFIVHEVSAREHVRQCVFVSG